MQPGLQGKRRRGPKCRVGSRSERLDYHQIKRCRNQSHCAWTQDSPQLSTVMKKTLMFLIWTAVAITGTLAIGIVAVHRGEPINALWLVVAATCCYALGYRFYSSFIAAKILAVDALRATPAERLENGRDFLVTNKWVVFGHHFAAIAGPGPLVGPVLAAQFGYLPGTLWIVAGAVLAGCVQDFVILLFSVRRDGKSLTEMAKEETGRVGGFVAYAAVIVILLILLAVVALVVVNALKSSPWGTFTIAMTIPIALLMGVYLRRIRPGKVLEASALGFVLVMLAIWGGQWVSQDPAMAHVFTLSAAALAGLIILYGFAASALPVWLLLAPRDYLSTFVKLGTIALLGLGIVVFRPVLHMPALTRFVDGTGPVFAGKIFPFAFITIACGAVSGFHSLISSGTTPKLIARETQTRMVGYGAMLAESAVAVMAVIAACVLQPGVYFAINSPAGIVGQAPEAAAATISAWGFPVTAPEMQALARAVGEQTLFNRTGGAPAFAVANQLLATVALCVATTIIIKMHRAKYALFTLAPLAWLVAVTFTASWHKILDPDLRVGFLAQAKALAMGPSTHATARLIFNNRLDAAVTAALVVMVSLVVIESARVCIGVLTGKREARLREAPFVMSRLAAGEHA